MQRLPINQRATDLWASLRGDAADTLVGDLVLVGDGNDDFADLDLSVAAPYLPFPIPDPPKEA